MMSNNIIQKASSLWNNDKIRVLVMLSLMLQMVLIYFAPLRKRSSNKKLLILLWLSYLGADYVAILALSSLLTDGLQNPGADFNKQNLTACWAPFLLLHLGGPDNITSFSVEDNELWLRHLLGFVVQVSVALVVLVLSLLQTTRLLVPSILIFIVGTIKFGERTLALRCASAGQIKEPDRLLFKKKKPDRSLELFERIKQGALVIPDSELISVAYDVFSVMKPHIVGTEFRYREDSQEFGTEQAIIIMVMHSSGMDFKLIGIQLSLFYDILHTKATVVHCNNFYVIRIASLVAMVIAFFFFHITEKRGYEISDLIITYILLSVALFLEIYSALRLVLSKWMTISLSRLDKKGAAMIAYFIFRAKNHIFGSGNKGQWSGRMRQTSLEQSFMKYKSNWFKKAWDFLFRGEESAEVPSILEETLINHVKNLVEPLSNYEEYGDLLRKIKSSWKMNILDRYNLITESDEMMVGRLSFEQCVMAWHMVTDICYITSNNAPGDSEQGRMREALHRVSNYMMYLLLERPSMMPRGIAEFTMEVTLIEYYVFRNEIHPDKKPYNKLSSYAVTDDYEDISSAMLLSRKILGDLENLEAESEESLWEVIRDAWMEMLTYSAVNCSQTEHARGLSRGGELLTHYWLLMAHYGIVDEYNEVLGWDILDQIRATVSTIRGDID